MASIKTYHTINIFDVKTIDYALGKYPDSYKYILRYTTFGEGASYTWTNPQGDTITTHMEEYSIYSVLISHGQILNIFQTKKHNYELDMKYMDPEIGYVTYDIDGSKLYMMHMMDLDGIYTILIAENKPGYHNVLIIGDDINSIDSTTEITDTHTVIIMPHESQDIDHLPASYMISYLSYQGNIDKFIWYCDYTPVPDIARELLLRYAPKVKWDVTFNYGT